MSIISTFINFSNDSPLEVNEFVVVVVLAVISLDCLAFRFGPLRKIEQIFEIQTNIEVTFIIIIVLYLNTHYTITNIRVLQILQLQALFNRK